MLKFGDGREPLKEKLRTQKGKSSLDF